MQLEDESTAVVMGMKIWKTAPPGAQRQLPGGAVFHVYAVRWEPFASRLFFSAPAVSAKLAVRQSDGLHQVVQAVEAQGGEIQPAADFLHHLPVILAV